MTDELSQPPVGNPLRKIVGTFVVVTLVLLALVGYVAFSRALVTVTLNSIEKEISFRLTLAEEAFGLVPPPGSLSATFLETMSEASGTFTPTGTTEQVGKAGGLVTLVNETDRDQPLVATTRLLTPEGVLFRLKEAVRVPARGTVTAAAEADEDGAGGEIGPARFTIPGLNPSLQAVIYATSSAPMVRGGAEEKAVTEQDLETARQTLRQKLLETARTSFTAQVGEGKLTPQDFVTEIVEERASASAGAAVRSFTVAVKLKIVGVVFDKSKMLTRVAADLDEDASPPTEDYVRYTISSFDAVARRATLQGRAKVGSTLSRESSIFSPPYFVGQTPEEVKTFLKNYEGVADVEVKISPYWQRHLPRIPGRISVEFK